MNIYAYVITYNEADRYLRDVLTNVKQQVNGVCVLDDRSTDGTLDIVRDLKVPYRIRSDSPSFLEDESAFRQEAWRLMEKQFSPKYGDWVLALDADEFLRLQVPLVDICQRAQRDYTDALVVHIHEMWTPTQIRIDGYWGTITGLRLCEYKPNGSFVAKKMGGGSLPSYPKKIAETHQADIIHFGYAKDEDKRAKYARYSETSGHSSQHINSILTQPMLAQMPGMV